MHISGKILVKIDGTDAKWMKVNRKRLKEKYKSISYSNFRKLEHDGHFNDSVYIFIENEEIYTKLITIPVIRKRYLYNIIENEIAYYFNDSSNMIYNYSELCRDKNKIKIIVACMNTSGINSLEKQLHSCRNISLTLIQTCFLDYFSKCIKDDSYIFLFYYNRSLYVLGCIDKVIISNIIIKDVDIDHINSVIINEFIDNCRRVYNEYKFGSIYYSNFLINTLIGKDDLNTKQINLGIFDTEAIVNYFVYGGKQYEWI